MTNLENSSLQDHAFDGDLRASYVYSRAQAGDVGGAEAKDLHHTVSMEEQQPSSKTPVESETSEEHIATPSSLGSAEVLSVTASFAADVESLSEDRHADKVKRLVHLTDDHGECQTLYALLDTGANRNYISEARFARLRLKSLTRKLAQPAKIRAADSEILVPYIVKGKWRFTQKTTFYTHWFYVVPNLAHDIIIGRHVIFEHALLMDNLELCSLGFPDELKPGPELYILGMSRLSKGKAHWSLYLSKPC